MEIIHFLSALRATGMTAYYAIKEIMNARAGDTVVVSGAAGAIGNMVVQTAKKLIGCKQVVGVAGNDEKRQWVGSLGAELGLNCKKPEFRSELAKAIEGYVDGYSDNVGGEILDLRMARHGRIAACGGSVGLQ